jgi:hypothetical protein
LKPLLLAAAAAITLAGTAALSRSAPASGPAACRADVPADLTLAPAHWLGDCPDGAAEGLGILRAGTAEPYEFFAGRMHQGHLVDGLLLLEQGTMMAAVRFDATRHVVSSDGLHPAEDDTLFRNATAAASAVSKRFAAAGNRGSATYYARLAVKIKNSQPE